MSSEAVLLAGGGAAILLQLADRRVGHGVARHSDFASRPLDRLHGTMTYLTAIVHGTPDEAAHVRRLVDRAHGPVHSERRAAPADGVAYDAFDRDAQLWVAATLYAAAVLVWDRLVGPMPDEAADRTYREYAIVGTALQVPEGAWPADRAAFRAWWDDRLAALVVDDEARDVARRLLHPEAGPLWLRAAMPLVRLVTAGLLPADVREAYRLPWDARRAARYERVMDVAAAVLPWLPRRLRHAPRDRYLAGLRRRMRTEAGRDAGRPGRPARASGRS